MIKKILVRDYLKGYGDMSAEERKAFVGRVGEWLAQDGARLLALTDRPMARSQSLVTITTRWTAEDARAVTDGIMLMSAMVAVAETWLPTQLYMKSAYRAVRQVVAILAKIPQGTERSGVGTAPELPAMGVKTVTRGNGKTSETAARLQGKGWQGHLQPVPAMKKLPKAEQMTKHPGIEKGSGVAGAGAGKPQALPSPVAGTGQTGKPLPMIKTVAKEYDAATDTVRVQCAVVPARPKHIDQYVHLLPKATQERAAEYGELMRQLGEARDNMQLLMDDDHASAKSREQWAKQATRIDKKIREIRDELDREWGKVAESGCVRIDDLGMAHFVSASQRSAAQNEDGTGVDGDGGEQKPVELTSEQKKRRRDLRKWLTDLRRGKEGKDREKRIEQWRVNWQEYLTLEPMEKAMEDEKILEAAKHFGIDIDGNAAEHEAYGDGVKRETYDDGAKDENAEPLAKETDEKE
jgi:hypothetical protein